MRQLLMEASLPEEFRLFSRGKVRDTFFIPSEMVDGQEDLLLQVATDRVSALNVKLKTGIPDRGKVLVGLTAFFAQAVTSIKRPLFNGIKTHIVEPDFDRFPKPIRDIESLRGRSLIVRRHLVIPIESVVRFRLTGTGWKDYQRTGLIFGHGAPEGTKEWDPVSEFACWTPTMKSANDEPLLEDMRSLIFNHAMMGHMRQMSIAVMKKISELASQAGFELIDGKLEWGINRANDLILIDEWGTPDACRWVTKDSLESGKPVSYDKDPIRRWLQPIVTKGGKVPGIPDEIVEQVHDRYLRLYELVTGQKIT
ncbi:MAG: phosphoribosylaminoimidazolesuccinocarboxamide synthase [bacterium]